MKKMKYLLTALCAFALFVTPVSANTGVDVTAELDEMTITYEVNTTEPITNGRIAITYNENEVEFVEAKANGLFDVEDINKDEETVDGMKTIYFAFASADAYEGEDTLAFTLVLEVKEDMVGKEVTITTEFEELANPEAIEKEDSTITVEIPEEEKEPETPVDPENPTEPEKPTDPEEPTKPEEGVDTGDHSNIGFYLVTFFVAAVVLAYIVIKDKKQVNN